MKNKPLKILFDAGPLVNGTKSGVGYYTYGLLDALAKNYPDDVEIVAHYFDFLGRKKGVRLPDHPNIKYVRSRIMPGKVLNILRKTGLQLPMELLFKTRGDIAVFPNFVSLPSISGIPSVVAVHDLCYEDVPQYVAKKNREFLRRFVPKSVKTAAGIITISESTKKAIEKHYEPNQKIMVAGIPPITIDVEPHAMTGINEGFILFVSTLEPRKNVIGLVKGYELLPEGLKKKHALVLAGGIGWDMEDEIDFIKQSQARGSNIVMTGYVSDQEKEWLYSNAGLFVMPSHYEGFGMPILEAMQHNLPVAVSDIDVFREVAGDSVIYFDKDSPDSVAKSLRRILEDKKLQKDLKSRGKEKLKNYSWKVVADEVYQLLFELKRG